MVRYKFLFIGGAGFIGYHLAKHLSELGHEIVIIDNLSRGKKDDDLNSFLKKHKIKFFNDDISSPIKIRQYDFDYIIHLAAILGVSNVKLNPYYTLYNNISILDSAINFSSKCKKLKKFIFFSTSEIYAASLRKNELSFPTSESSNVLIDQEFPNRDSYFLSKIIGEAMIKYSKKNYIIFRPHNFFGERMGNSHVVPELYAKINSTNKNTILLNNPNHFRCFCYIGDAVKLMSKVILSKKVKNISINVGDNTNEISIQTLADLISLYCNKKINFNPVFDIDESPIRRLPDIKLILSFNKSFNFTKFEYALSKTLDWYSKRM